MARTMNAPEKSAWRQLRRLGATLTGAPGAGAWAVDLGGVRVRNTRQAQSLARSLAAVERSRAMEFVDNYRYVLTTDDRADLYT